VISSRHRENLIGARRRAQARAAGKGVRSAWRTVRALMLWRCWGSGDAGRRRLPARRPDQPVAAAKTKNHDRGHD
jgi:hypothetical protein